VNWRGVADIIMREVNPTISFGGDVRVAKPLPTRLKNSALGLFQGSNEVVVNLEAPATDAALPQSRKWAVLKQSPAVIGQLKTAGVTIFHLANNHMMDYGAKGLTDTLRTIDSAGVSRIGAGVDAEEAFRPVIKTLPGGIRAGFIGVSCTNPPGSGATKLSPGVAAINVHSWFYVENSFLLENPGTPPIVVSKVSQKDLNFVGRLVRSVKNTVDFLAVTVHWGVPFQEYVVDYQVELGHALIDWGADLIVGHHTHTIQAVEMYKSKPIFYGIGHLMFTLKGYRRTLNSPINPFPPNVGHWGMSPSNLIVSVKFRDNMPAYRIHFAYCQSDNPPILLTGRQLVDEFTKLRVISKRFGANFAMEDDGAVDVLAKH